MLSLTVVYWNFAVAIAELSSLNKSIGSFCFSAKLFTVRLVAKNAEAYNRYMHIHTVRISTNPSFVNVQVN